MKIIIRLLLTICAALILLALSCGLERGTPLKQAKKPPKIRDTGRLGEICRDIVLDARKEKENPKAFNNLADLKLRFLQGHNDIRKRYSMPELVWDDNIAIYAQAWADYLKANNKCLMEHRSTLKRRDGKKYGENLAWNWTSKAHGDGLFAMNPEFAIWGWSKECKDYSFVDASCRPNKKCGHFTKMVWEDSKKVGCGMALCNGTQTSEGRGRAEIWVCNYDPAGNVVEANGKPLKPF